MRARASLASLVVMSVAFALPSACSSFSSEAPLTSDAGADATDAPDATHAATDAGFDAADASPLPCAARVPQPTFCIDFDEGKVPTFYLSNVVGDVTTTAAQTPSGGFSLRTVGGFMTPGTGTRQVAKTLTAGKVTLTHRVRVTSGPKTTSRSSASRVVTGVDGSLCVFELRLSATNAVVSANAQGTIGTERDLLGDPGPDTWFDVKLVLTGGNTDFVMVDAQLDGKSTLAGGAFESNCAASQLSPVQRVDIGVSNGPETMEMFYDDVVLEAE